MKKTILRLTAHTIILSLTYQLVFPVCAYALTTGPSQPEVQSFEPVGTTDMVNTFSGDFNYNIPLLDVEGYPVNISYHSGINMEQEASWVGLGWNINPGEINRTVRGLPDDFNGETIDKELNIQSEKNVRVGGGFNTEVLGFASLGVGISVNANNYKGLSASIDVGLNAKFGNSNLGGGAGINMGIGSQTGADMDLSANVGAGASRSVSKDGGTAGVGVSATGGTGFNSRTGLKDLSFGFGISSNVNPPGGEVKDGNKIRDLNKADINNFSYGSTIPIGLQNYVPVVANASTLNTVQFQIKGGGEAGYAFPNLYLNAAISNLTYDVDGSRKGYGYLYAENAPDNGTAILDFSRDKDGVYNKTLPNLPLSNPTFDIYTVSGHGTGGMFRPFRNDIGTTYDPVTASTTSSEDNLFEFGIGELFEVGADLNFYDNELRSGPWKKIGFGGATKGSLYEKAYFKQAGELTYNQQADASSIFNNNPVYLKEDMNALVGKGGANAGVLPAVYDGKRILWNNTTIDRTTRANLLTFFTAAQASTPDVAQYAKYQEQHSANGNTRYFDPVVTTYDRYNKTSNSLLVPQADHISEFTQVVTDGRRYIYGIPAMNNVTREVTFNVNEDRANVRNGMVAITRDNGIDDSRSNNEGREHFYSSTTTPAYAHSYLLSSVLSNDYVDVMGDGPTDDDLGTYAKFNYTLVDNDYRWRAPYNKDSAQYNPGFWSDYKDGKGNYIVGSRQQWHLRSIESKNYIAEFYISPRSDGQGTKAAILNGDSKLGSGSSYATGKSSESVSYRLDSIKLYNKHDRYLNEDNAVPVKTVIFSYSYNLCPGTVNSIAPNKGKLTLERIYIRYGNSDKNLLSPYVFSYNNPNPAYDFAAKDRWGNYKPNNDPNLSNYEFPYTAQEGVGLDDQIASWNLTGIKLPSGGKINVKYESDDYSFVQDRRSMQMFNVVGIGNSPTMQNKTTLYEDENTVNDYVYFKRRKDKEIAGLTPAQNYLNDSLLYYSFNMDITGTGRYEHIKGYARVARVDYCDADYGYVQLKKEQVKGLSMHPATVYGLNIGRYYLPHIFYPGSPDGDQAGVLRGLMAAAGELTRMWQNPFTYLLKKKKGRNVKIAKSWIRLHTPGLTKKGGGVRVKQLTLDDNWQSLSSSPNNASYGKQYDYTITDPTYGKISSGVASYEPMVGGDENPFRRPIPYQAEAGRLLPAIDFFQEEPLGEGFFPPAEVGYSSVKVRSIHQNEGRSSQAEDEYLFYTAKDYPVIVDYTQKDAPSPHRTHSLRSEFQEEKVWQGYALIFNDMHGKPKAVNNYVLGTANGATTKQRITGTVYRYQEEKPGKLSNTVNAMYRKRGTVNEYTVGSVTLGKEMDFSIDTRERYFRSYSRNVALNLNAVLWGLVLVPIPTAFFPDKEQEQIFHTMVGTKVIQQYGIVKSVETFDHGATTISENVLYDAETGSVLLTKTNNEFNDNMYNLKYPAYLAYEGMGAAYTNVGFEEIADSLVVNKYLDGFIYTDNLAKYQAGDELLVNANGTNYKVWVTGIGTNPDTGQVTIPGTKGHIVVYAYLNSKVNALPISLTCTGPNGYSSTGSLTQSLFGSSFTVACGMPNAVTFDVDPGTYTISTTANGSIPYTVSNTFPVLAGQCSAWVLNDAMGSGAANRPSGGDGLPCAVKVSPRYKTAYVNSAPTTNIAVWPNTKSKFGGVSVKVLRSGKRNNLSSNVQQTVLSKNPYAGSINDLFGNTTANGNAFDNLLAISVNKFADSAQSYDDYNNEVAYNTGNTDTRYVSFNSYVQGFRGNYRPSSDYVRFANRSYTSGHTRYDGTFPIGQTFWGLFNGMTFGECGSERNVLNPNPVNPTFWKLAHTTTKYDVYGNATEEIDALGNYSAAAYGYNKALPVAVASNARQEDFFFDGFEDYRMLIPEYTKRMYWDNLLGAANPQYRASPIMQLFANYQASFNNQGTTGPLMQRGGQRFTQKLTTSPYYPGMTLTTEASHTGSYALKFTTSAQLTMWVLNQQYPQYNETFYFTGGKQYLVDAWVKSSTGASISSIASQCSFTIGSATVPVVVKTGSIDGWYLIEATVNAPAGAQGSYSNIYLNLPAGIYLDDMRAFTKDANMKSFVYDPMTFKLAAQLDENHFATFYEYDQEGLLVRVKKETDRGVLTVSESRRSNMKKP